MATIERYRKLKVKVDRLRREHDRAEGALEQAMVKLQKQHGCKTLEEGKVLLSKTEKDCKRKRSKFDKAMERFDEEWGEKLSE